MTARTVQTVRGGVAVVVACCPACGEHVERVGQRCRYCHRVLTAADVDPAIPLGRRVRADESAA